MKAHLAFGLCLMSMQVYANFNQPPAGCHEAQLTCIEPGETRIISGVPVYQPCWKYDVSYACPDWSHYTNSCAKELNCSPLSEPVIVDGWKKELRMQCQETSVSYHCLEYRERKDCDGNFSYSMGYEQFTPGETHSFKNAMAVMGMLDALQKNMKMNELRIFDGEAQICKRPLEAGPFTTNCCDKDLNTHGGRLSLNQCSKEEIKLASARRGNRTHYIGDWCEHHLPWPLNHICIERRRGYCIFNSLLSRLIEEQGREQINSIALSGGKNQGSTETFIWPYALPTSQWNRTTIKGVDIATYSWVTLNQNTIPILLSIQDPLTVRVGERGTLDNVTIDFNCKDGRCSGEMFGDDTSLQFTMDPICITPASWLLNGMSVRQGMCLKSGDQPRDWPSITWHENLPNLWQFQLLRTFDENIVNNAIDRLLPNGKEVNAMGQCEGDNCRFLFKVIVNSDTQQKELKFPLSCRNSDEYKINVNGVDIAPKCLDEKEIIAVCIKGSGCGQLPAQPEDFIDQEINGWLISSLELNVPNYKFLTPSVAAKGNCTQNLCQWSFTSIGPSGLQTILVYSAKWNIFSAPIKNETIQPGFHEGLILPNNVVLKPYLYAPGTDISKGFALQYRLPNEANFKDYPGSIPLSVTENESITLNVNPLIKFYGKCDQTIGVCNYHLLSEVKVKAMPWGSPKHPQCEGFSPENLMLLDFSKINLSEWTKTLTAQLGKDENENLTQLAKNSINDFYNAMNNGSTIEAKGSNSSDRVVLNVTPTEAQGPFDVTLDATAFWPKYIPYGQCDYPSEGSQNKSVGRLRIEWGDGQSNVLEGNQTTLVSVLGQNYAGSNTCNYQVPVFKLTHHYQEPPGHNVIENIHAVFKVDGQTHHSFFKVNNYWNTPDQINAVGGGASDPNSHVIHPNQMPGSNPYLPKEVPGTPK